MKFKEFAALAVHANRLRDASTAMTACMESMADEDKPQAFNYAGVTFTGHDASVLKSSLMHGLSMVADDATAVLMAAGVEAPEAPPEGEVPIQDAA